MSIWLAAHGLTMAFGFAAGAMVGTCFGLMLGCVLASSHREP